ncbi:HNH endonuclease [Marinobacterium sp. AK62]|uniref:HNH endonuclease n=2 Tax=Marinobacterium alkalitolerans TaxID=1542925 RepID=A0ABS3Z8D9_9GAMM|nr:HNH endonuclease [Marinobacterium alkalitolerans]
MSRNDWTPNEVKLAFHLYCQLPYGRLHRNNPAIIELAQLIGRTPSAVAMKLVNLASLDPAILASGRKGFSNASKLDRETWDAFHSDWEGLVLECDQIKAGLTKTSAPEALELNTTEIRAGTTRPQVIQQRVGQSFFRRAVLSSYANRCCLTGLSEERLLIASHIVPWSQDPANRLNPSNGLCLSALYDRAFDQGLITFDENWRLVVSPQLTRTDPAITANFYNLEGQAIELPERFSPDARLMDWHREQIFINSSLDGTST